ncbi:Phosphopantetheine attachment site [Chitinophaga eiseniae]|uniref:Phosphopantetheine attachment site n=1 Tax=Chitinophaga eiseniae TaxID=634771 RepID=A0A1T4QRZ8_9BACT|nr:non-ribosomal peptide synthetase [Chitinophaga eiseniae]SKA06553.1 Phosphopantetheine attachment site [Chitinophaga eiseniae]
MEQLPTPISDLGETYDQVIFEWNDTDNDYPVNKTILDLFQEQVMKTSDKIALVYEDQQLSYKELNEKSNQLARNIRSQYLQKTGEGLRPDTFIALFLDRGLEMVVGILGVLKAGGAYVPIATDYPQEKVNYMLDDIQAALILSQHHLKGNKNIELPEEKIIRIDLTEDLYQKEDISNLPRYNKATDLVYLLYTSGTTDKPKGVMLEHRSVCNRILYCISYSDISASDYYLFKTNYIFDVSFSDIFMHLCAGATLQITKYVFELNELNRLLLSNKFTSLHLVPSQYDLIASTINAIHLRKIFFSGEDLTAKILSGITNKNIKIYNYYGPTETGETTVFNPLSPSDGSIIGRAFPNCRLYVLDENRVPVPIGVEGELYVGGVCLFRGYLNRPDLTEDRFIINPFATEADVAKGYNRLYKTGDLVRWLPSGNLKYIGRNDDQIKLRGYRIEPGEIEHALSQIQGIRQSFVLAKERTTASGTIKYLAAYYVLDSRSMSTDYKNILDGWKDIYDIAVYEENIEEDKIASDFSGWNSYITGEPIPLSEMQQWRDEILKIIKSLNPNCVLDIGVGSGLLMYPLLGHVQKYVGLDISQSIINRHQRYLENKGYNVNLYKLNANELDKLPPNELYDTIIINSVCQLFPSINYFESVLEKAISKLSEKGNLFLGDIRNYELHKALIKEKFEYDGKNYSQQDIDRIALKENELLISPDYFRSLTNTFKDIQVNILERAISYGNELNRFRYDVVISLNRKEQVDSQNKILQENFSGISDPDTYINYNIPYLNQIDREEILRHLSAVLPSYMIPDALVQMRSFPLTINGKLDKRALPDPDFNISSDDYVAPTGETALTISNIWRELLGLDRVGIKDNFFRIGGNSILAMQVSYRMSKALRCDLKVSDIFEHGTIEELLKHSLIQEQSTISQSESRQAQLSFAQDRLWFMEQYEEGASAYHIPELYELDEDADMEGLKYALREIVSRHEVLRSTIEQDDFRDHGIQIVHEDALPVHEKILTDKDDYEALIKEDIRAPFNLSMEYPIRVIFYTITSDTAIPGYQKDKRLLLINTHHIASDGWSADIFQKELVAYYEAYINNNINFRLPSLEIQYKDYAVWQRGYLTGDILEKQLNYWKKKLSGYQPLEFPIDYERPGQMKYQGAGHEFIITKDISEKLRDLAKRCNTTLHTVLLSSINILLCKYTGCQDIITGSPIANRHYQQTQDLIGFFVNMQVNRTQLNLFQTYLELVEQVHQDQVEAQLHQDFPFEKLVEELGIDRDTSRHPVFQVFFVVQNFGNQYNAPDQQKKYWKVFDPKKLHEVARFDLSIYIDDSRDELMGYINYATSLFREDTITKLTEYYIHLLEQLTAAPEKYYSEFSLLDTRTYNQIVYDWNDTEKAYPESKTIIDIFLHQVKQTPDAIALSYGNSLLTYQELDERSNQLAYFLHNRGVVSGTLVPICIDRSVELLVGILGILKAGGAYMPIDPKYPQERISHMLSDTDCQTPLTTSVHRHLFESERSICVDILDDLLQVLPTASINYTVSVEQLAYVMYTSGSTGRPKGVAVTHQNVTSIAVGGDFVSLGAIDVLLSTGSPAFDASTIEYWGMLLNGGHLVLLTEEELLDIDRLQSTIADKGVSKMWFTSSWLNQLVDADLNIFSGLKTVLVGGEKLSHIHIDKLRQTYPEMEIINGYGPTENTTFSLTYRIGHEVPSPIPIGRPLGNRTAYVLDGEQQLLPVGAVGELYVGGAGLSRGYINRPDLTAERFIPNMFATEKDKLKGYTKLYKTGDLVRWLPDGNLEYIGRNDDQVKIRGYRIELGEIESFLERSGLVKQTVVTVRTDASETKSLIAYVVPGTGYTEEGLLSYLSARLPGYMIPSMIVEQERLPLTPNGKIDKDSLPNPDFFERTGIDYSAPRTTTEGILSAIWREALSLERISIHDDFFRLGGDSILSIGVISRIRKALNKPVKLYDLYQYTTISSLGSLIDNIPVVNNEQTAQQLVSKEIANLKEELLPSLLTTMEIEDIYPMSSIQVGMVHASLLGTDLAVFHEQITYALPIDLDTVSFKKAFSLLVQKHEIFRTAFNLNSHEDGLQIVFKTVPIDIHFLDQSHLNLENARIYLDGYMESERGLPFDVTHPPLWRSTLIRFQDQYAFVFQFHHAILDGWSLSTFIMELDSLYSKLQAGLDIPRLDRLQSSYKDFVIKGIIEKRQDRSKAFWQQELRGYKRLDIFTPEKEVVEFVKVYDPSFLQRIQQKSQADHLSLKTVFLGAYLFVLQLLTHEEEVTLGVQTNTRPLLDDGDRLVGCFLNSIPFRFASHNSRDTWQSYFEAVEQKMLTLKEHDHTALFEIKRMVGEDYSHENAFSDVFFNFINFHVLNGQVKGSLGLEAKGPLSKSILNGYYTLTNTYLDCTVDITNGDVTVILTLTRKLKSGIDVTTLHEYFKSVLDSYLNHYSQQIDRHQVIGAGILDQLLNTGAGTAVDYPRDKTIVHLFEEQVEKNPDNIALVFESQQLTYAELNNSANQMAHYLRNYYEIHPDDLIGIKLDRNEWMIITIFGILKAGAAYVPVDPEDPEERIKYKKEDSKWKLLIDDIELTKFKAEKETYRQTNPSSINCSLDLACIVYTSGSTGDPKGCMLANIGIVNHLFSKIHLLKLDSAGVICHNSQLYFVGGIWQLFAPLVVGAKVILCNYEELRNTTKLLYKATNAGATILEVIPSQLNEHIFNEKKIDLSKIEILILTGEKLNRYFVDRCYSGNPHLQIINTYGQTECSDVTTFYKIPRQYTDNNVLIGRPIQNTQIYISSAGGWLCPIGVIGEICTSGDGVSRGYINKPALTAEKFVSSPFKKDHVLYKTGDLGRWLPDGNIEIFGRKDDQIKIRGHRIEVAEIQQSLLQYEGIDEVVLLLQGENEHDKVLTAYIVSKQQFSVSSIRSYLEKRIPRYMIPSHYIQLDKIPLLPNGKIDKKTISQFKGLHMQLGVEYVAPRNDLESKLVKIWEGILKKERIGIYDDFFHLGGHSLLMFRVLNGVNAMLEKPMIRLVDLMKHTTIEQLAGKIETCTDPFEEFNPHIIKLREGDNTIITFIIPGMPGISDGYVELAQKISSSGAVYGLQMRGFMKDDSLNSIEEMAAHNIALINSIGSVKRIRLYAHSYGGTVVYEMLRQLSATAIEVRDIVLIESFPFKKQLSFDKDAVWLFINAFFVKTSMASPPFNDEILQLLEKPASEWMELLYNVLYKKELVNESTNFRWLWQLYEKSLSVKYDYTEKLPYSIKLIVTDDTEKRFPLLKLTDWNNYFQEVRVIHSGGDHFSVIKEPYCSKWITEMPI